MAKSKAVKNQNSLEDALRTLLIDRKANTQDNICHALDKQGYEVNQSKVSRLLRKIGAVKVVHTDGQTIYSLPREPSPPTMATTLNSLILDIAANETLVVISTSPGCASMIARVLDYNQISIAILGTIAGDDTIFVTPKSIKDTPKLLKEIKSLLKD